MDQEIKLTKVSLTSLYITNKNRRAFDTDDISYLLMSLP